MIALQEAFRVGLFTRHHFLRNLVSGLVVGIVALPLAMAFAIASGAKPEQGIYTAIVAGLLSAVLGGSRLQISGPTGAFIVILSGITAQYGIAGLQIATLMAGVMLVAMGIARMGVVIRYIPNPVITGFTAGIGVIIWVGQWKDFFGLQSVLTQPAGEHFHEKLYQLLSVLTQFHGPTTALASLSLILLIVCPRFIKRVPAPLIAMLVATFLQAYYRFDGVATIGSAFGGIPQSLPEFVLPSLTFKDVIRLMGPAFTIALLGAIESLLSAVVADGMAGTRHDPNQELIGQGVANIASPLFGGFASTGAIARTATNIRNGATSPLSGVVHALFLVLVLVFLAPYAAYIPLCALAAILFVVAYNMSELPHFFRLVRMAPATDISLLLITFLLTVFADLVIAVNVGVMLAAFLFMHRMAKAVEVREEDLSSERGGEELRLIPKDTLVYSIDGPFFFGAAEKLENTLEYIQSHMNTVVLRMGKVPFVDVTGMDALDDLIVDFQRHKTRVVLVEIRENVRARLEKAGVLARVGEENLFCTLSDFIENEKGGKERPS